MSTSTQNTTYGCYEQQHQELLLESQWRQQEFTWRPKGGSPFSNKLCCYLHRIINNEHLRFNILYEISRKRLISYKMLKRKCSYIYVYNKFSQLQKTFLIQSISKLKVSLSCLYLCIHTGMCEHIGKELPRSVHTRVTLSFVSPAWNTLD